MHAACLLSLVHGARCKDFDSLGLVLSFFFFLTQWSYLNLSPIEFGLFILMLSRSSATNVFSFYTTSLALLKFLMKFFVFFFSLEVNQHWQLIRKRLCSINTGNCIFNDRAWSSWPPWVTASKCHESWTANWPL